MSAAASGVPPTVDRQCNFDQGSGWHFDAAAKQLRCQPFEAGIMPDHRQTIDFIRCLLGEGQQLSRRRIIDSLVVTRRQAGKLGGLGSPCRRARQNQIKDQAKVADFLSDTP